MGGGGQRQHLGLRIHSATRRRPRRHGVVVALLLLAVRPATPPGRTSLRCGRGATGPALYRPATRGLGLVITPAWYLVLVPSDITPTMYTIYPTCLQPYELHTRYRLCDLVSIRCSKYGVNYSFSFVVEIYRDRKG